MTIKCCACGKFIPYTDMESGMASFFHEPDNHFGPEVNEWTCNACVIEESHHREEWLATVGVWDQ